ncbi:MAG: hypothetical protein IPP35_06735 [Elusimicrobia bacterium]|nr:hypothetical protein [Elusimicrobiota bacterium]
MGARLHFLRWAGVLLMVSILVNAPPNRSGRVLDRMAPAVYQALKTLRAPARQFEFPVDNTGPGGRTYTKSTNIGLDLLSTVAALEQGQEDPFLGLEHVRRVVQGLSTLRTHRGIFPEYVHLNEDGAVADVADGRIRYSSVDSAWLHFALSVAGHYFRPVDPALARAMEKQVDAADYSLFLHDDNRRFRHGVTVLADDDSVAEAWPYDYDNKNSEARLLIVFLTAAGKIPPDVWRAMTYDTVQVEGLTVADGWKLSAFVELAGNIYFDEAAIAPCTLGAHHLRYVEASRRIAFRRGFRFYGWAPCYGPGDTYQEYGLSHPEVVSPYAVALLATVGEKEALLNFHKFVQSSPSLAGAAPFPDAVDPRTGGVLNRRALSLNQNLFYHALSKDALRRVVARAGWHAKASRLIADMDEEPRPLK